MAVEPGLVGGLVGCAVGLAGGIIGTRAGIRSAEGPRERRFMVRSAAAFWVAGLALLAMLLLLPLRLKWIPWAVYGVALPLGIIRLNRAQKRIRSEESGGEGGVRPPSGS